MQATVEWQTPQSRGIGHIIDEVVEATVRVGDPLRGSAGERPLWRVTLGAAWARLVGADLGLHYDPAPIASLRHGISQAVARFMLTHRSGSRWAVEDVLTAVGVKGSGQDRRNARRRLRADADGLAALGVGTDGGYVWVDSVPHRPGSVPHRPDSVPHRPDSVPHRPDSVPHRPDP